MRDKLEKIIAAYEELEQKMVDPAVVSDPKEYARIAKEHADQAALVAKAREYLQALDDIEAAKEMLHEASDAEEKEMLQADISENESKLPALEEDVKYMLIPGDPNDEKDTIVEIRAGVGGDEAQRDFGVFPAVEFRGADQVAHVFDEENVEVFAVERLQGFADHAAVEVASAFGIDLYGLCAGSRHTAGVVVGLKVTFDHGHAEFSRKVVQRAFQKGRLAGTGGADEIEHESAATGEVGAKARGNAVIGFQYVADNGNFHDMPRNVQV